MLSRMKYLPYACLAAMLAMSGLAYPFLPPVMTIHWSFTLQADGFASKPVAVLILPALVGLLILMQTIGRMGLDTKLEGEFSRVVLIASPVLVAAHALVIAAAL